MATSATFGRDLSSRGSNLPNYAYLELHCSGLVEFGWASNLEYDDLDGQARLHDLYTDDVIVELADVMAGWTPYASVRKLARHPTKSMLRCTQPPARSFAYSTGEAELWCEQLLRHNTRVRCLDP